ncbi:MAG: hypothetical protein IPM82_05590 [Saprospiraceae bacterium]|nr:hypothetical protein [Saprospiraceae bacterium]
MGDGFLVPPKKLETGTKFLRRGIKYSELSEAEQQEYESAFGPHGRGGAR